jgi:hypothetical protein
VSLLVAVRIGLDKISQERKCDVSGANERVDPLKESDHVITLSILQTALALAANEGLRLRIVGSFGRGTRYPRRRLPLSIHVEFNETKTQGNIMASDRS